MAISFNEITDLRVPFVAVEFDNTRAQQGPAVQPFETLILGQKLSSGSADELTLYSIASEAEARTKFGPGSMLQYMVKRYKQNDKVTPLKVIAIDDLDAGVAATGKITVPTITASEDGVLYLWIGGKEVEVSVSEDDDQDAIASAINTAIGADDELQVTSEINATNANEVDLTAKHKGEVGNYIDLRVNHYDDQEYPGNVTVTFTDMASGSGNPDVSEIIAMLPENQYNTIVHPWIDSSNLSALETELESRFGPMEAIESLAITVAFDTLSNLETLGNGRNSKVSSIVTGGKSAPQAPWEWAAAVGGQTAKAAQIDPARPFQTLGLDGIIAPKESELFILSERDQMLRDGIATTKVVAGAVQIERLITTWQTNDAGQADTSYLDANTFYTLSYLRYDFRNMIATKFPRAKLADDGTRFGPGQKVVTPSVAKSVVADKFDQWERLGLVEGKDQFIRDLVIERNASNPNRLDFLLPPDLVNQFRNTAAQIQFLL